MAWTLAPSAPSEADDAALAVSPAVGHPLQRIVVKGSGFGSNETVDLSFDGLAAGAVVAGPDGSFVSGTRVPGVAQPGPSIVAALGLDSGTRARASFFVRTNWAMFRGGPARTGFNPYENVISPSNVSGLHKAWTAPLGTSFASPALVDGVLYEGAYYNDHFYALDHATGAVLWTFPTGPIESSAAVVNGVVYVASDSGDVFALDASTGAELWSHPIGLYGSSSPVVAGGIVYLAGGDDDMLHALDARTGGEVWSFLGGSYVSSPAVADRIVYAGSLDGNLYALDATTGSELWRVATGGPVYTAPTVADGRVYVGPATSYVLALDAATGDQLWRFHTGASRDGGGSSAAVADGVLYVGSGDDHVYALDANTGVMRWRVTIGGYRRFPSPPTVANGVVYFGVWSAGGLYAVDAATGALLLRFGHVKTTLCSPVVADGTVYIASDSGTLWALDLSGPAGTPASTKSGTAPARGGSHDLVGTAYET